MHTCVLDPSLCVGFVFVSFCLLQALAILGSSSAGATRRLSQPFAIICPVAILAQAFATVALPTAATSLPQSPMNATAGIFAGGQNDAASTDGFTRP